MSSAEQTIRPNAVMSGRRRIIVLSGERNWCLGQLAQHFDTPVDLYFGEQPDGLAVRQCEPQSAAHQYLGGETGSLVFDSHSGFDPDAFGAACGLLKGSGLFFLLAPDFEVWPDARDSQKNKLAVYPHSGEEVGGRYFLRLISVIESDEDCLLVRQKDTSDAATRITIAANDVSCAPPFPVAGLTPDQQQAVVAMERVVTGHRKRPLVLVADRGRGKSAALGFGVKRLLANRDLSVIVTAPRKSAVEAVFRHAGEYAERVSFYAPDELVRAQIPCDVLMVDEAAAIPASILTQLLEHYPRLIFSTTVHGYEGSGRGFAVRFRQTLDRETPGWKECRMHRPVRWAEHDALERFCFRALMLDAEPAAIDPAMPVKLNETQIEWLDRDQLWRDETTLRELFGLLVLAHYETRPMDLYYLLDALNLSVVVMRWRGHVIATALVASEGGIEGDLAEKVVRGERRPQGHLLAQSLAIVCADEGVLAMRGGRIVRIAVLPALQGQGVGSKLLAEIEASFRQSGCEYLGTSFGVDTRILPFWTRAGFVPAKLGAKRNRASGAHSLLMVKGLTASGERLQKKSVRLFREQLLYAASDRYADLRSELIAMMLEVCAADNSHLDETELRILQDFAFYQRSYEASSSVIWKFASSLRGQRLPAMLVARILQKKDWSVVADEFGLGGRKAVLEELRSSVARLLSQQE